ncbi:MAG: hypothetical protein AABW59_03225 [archaeon]
MMIALENRVDGAIKMVEELHDSLSKISWAELNRNGFVAELEKSVSKLKSLQFEMEQIDKELSMLLEKNTPSFSNYLIDFKKEYAILFANVSLEKAKRIREDIALVNETEDRDVPELYSSLQQKIMELILKSRYNLEKARTFLLAKKIPFVKKGAAAKDLLDLLQRKDDELSEEKKKTLELRRKAFFGIGNEKNIAETERELNELDKSLNTSVSESAQSLKTHLAQIKYVEGSFANLKDKVMKIESMHGSFTKKSSELIKELKKERDYAKNMALQIEEDTLRLRTEYTSKILDLEEKKIAAEERAGAKYEKQVRDIQREIEEKNIALKNARKTIEDQEKEIRRLKSSAK